MVSPLAPEEREDVYRTLKIEPCTDQTIATVDRLGAEIEEGIKRGWQLNREESVPSATTVSATYMWDCASFIITVAGTSFRLGSRLDQAVERCCLSAVAT